MSNYPDGMTSRDWAYLSGDEEAAYEKWLEANEKDMAEEFFEKYGVDAFDEKAWELYLERRWEQHCQELKDGPERED